ncbi:MAG TPA: hypothetical protein VF466_03740 [Candidatus Saccharimonadales bacterium]
MNIREAYNRFATTAEGASTAVGLSLNVVLSAGFAIDALRQGDLARFAEGSALALGLGGACVDLALRHDTGRGLPAHTAELAGVVHDAIHSHRAPSC